MRAGFRQVASKQRSHPSSPQRDDESLRLTDGVSELRQLLQVSLTSRPCAAQVGQNSRSREGPDAEQGIGNLRVGELFEYVSGFGVVAAMHPEHPYGPSQSDGRLGVV